MKKNKMLLIAFFFLGTLFSGKAVMAERYSNYKLTRGDFRSISVKQIVVTAGNLNIRTGPGIKYPVIGAVKKNDILDVLGAIDNWYVVYLNDGSVGVVSFDYTKVSQLNNAPVPEGDSEASAIAPSTENEDQGALFGLVNQYRGENQRTAYTWDDTLNKVAQLKADDMVKNDYFGHTSKDYGTPFNMIKQMGILYKSASENIIYNKNLENAHTNLVSNPSQRSNILSSRFNKMGVGVAESPKYGKIIVELFIEE